MSVREWMDAELSRFPEAERRSVLAHRSLWHGIPEHMVVLNLDLRPVEHIEADYQAAMVRIAKRILEVTETDDFTRMYRRLAVEVLLHHENPGSWYYTSVTARSFNILKAEFKNGQLTFDRLCLGMFGDIVFASTDILGVVRFALEPACDFIKSYYDLRSAGVKTVRLPCHRGDAGLDYLRSPVLNPTTRRCAECGRGWTFERGMSNLVNGMAFNEVEATDNGWPLPDLGLSLKLR